MSPMAFGRKPKDTPDAPAKPAAPAKVETIKKVETVVKAKSAPKVARSLKSRQTAHQSLAESDVDREWF